MKELLTQHEHEIRGGVFTSAAAAEQAVRRLAEEGVDEDRIRVVHAETEPHPTEDVEDVDARPRRAIPPALVGGAIGALIGGGIAAVATGATGAAGLGLIGPVLGGAIGLGLIGGYVGAMTARGAEDELADFHERELAGGEVLVAVDDSDANDQPSSAVIERTLRTAGARMRELPEE